MITTRFAKSSLSCALLGFAFLSASAHAVTRRAALDDGDVQKIVSAAQAALAAQHVRGCIAVADADGAILYLQRQADAFLNCLPVVQAKIKTATEFQAVTNDYYQNLLKGQLVMLAVPDLAPLPGGMPLYVGKDLVGAVAVSTPTAEADIAVVQAAAAAFKP